MRGPRSTQHEHLLTLRVAATSTGKAVWVSASGPRLLYQWRGAERVARIASYREGRLCNKVLEPPYNLRLDVRNAGGWAVQQIATAWLSWCSRESMYCLRGLRGP